MAGLTCAPWGRGHGEPAGPEKPCLALGVVTRASGGHSWWSCTLLDVHFPFESYTPIYNMQAFQEVPCFPPTIMSPVPGWPGRPQTDKPCIHGRVYVHSRRFPTPGPWHVPQMTTTFSFTAGPSITASAPEGSPAGRWGPSTLRTS